MSQLHPKKHPCDAFLQMGEGGCTSSFSNCYLLKKTDLRLWDCKILPCYTLKIIQLTNQSVGARGKNFRIDSCCTALRCCCTCSNRRLVIAAQVFWGSFLAPDFCFTPLMPNPKIGDWLYEILETKQFGEQFV